MTSNSDLLDGAISLVGRGWGDNLSRATAALAGLPPETGETFILKTTSAVDQMEATMSELETRLELTVAFTAITVPTVATWDSGWRWATLLLPISMAMHAFLILLKVSRENERLQTRLNWAADRFPKTSS